MEVNSINSTIATNTFKDFRMPKNNSTPIKSENPNQSVHIEHHHKEDKGFMKKAVPLAGAVLGTVLPIIILNKTQGKKLNGEILKTGGVVDKLKEIGEYFEIDSVPKILSTAGGAMAGGLLGGCIVDKDKESRMEKVKEGTFEMTNITIPTLLVAGTMKFMQSKKLDKGIGKFAPVVIGLGAGIPIAQKISNVISKKIFNDKGEERKFKPTDLLVHTDDLIEMLVLLKIPFVKQLHIDKVLALIYAKCGYETGTKDVFNKSEGHHHHH